MKVDIEGIKNLINIEDVLNRYGINHKRSRCRCPIHKGSNPTSFSFNDTVFHCHSCGASGNVFQLIQYLENCGFRESLKGIAAMAGISIDDNLPDRKPQDIPLPKRDPEPFELAAQRGVLDILREWQERTSGELRGLRDRLKAGEIDLPEYYLRQPILDYQLEDIDQAVIAVVHRIHEMERDWRAKRNGE
jgi:hypothetical protein